MVFVRIPNHFFDRFCRSLKTFSYIYILVFYCISFFWRGFHLVEFIVFLAFKKKKSFRLLSERESWSKSRVRTRFDFHFYHLNSIFLDGAFCIGGGRTAMQVVGPWRRHPQIKMTDDLSPLHRSLPTDNRKTRKVQNPKLFPFFFPMPFNHFLFRSSYKRKRCPWTEFYDDVLPPC